jgi:hypothetical protein
VRKYVTRIAIKRHDTSKKHDSIHRDCDICWALFGLVSSLKTIVPFESKDVVVDLRRRRVGVTNFSTREGCDGHFLVHVALLSSYATYLGTN